MRQESSLEPDRLSARKPFLFDTMTSPPTPPDTPPKGVQATLSELGRTLFDTLPTAISKEAAGTQGAVLSNLLDNIKEQAATQANLKSLQDYVNANISRVPEISQGSVGLEKALKHISEVYGRSQPHTTTLQPQHTRC